MKLTSNDKTLLERCAKSPITYSYALPGDNEDHGVLLRSTSSTKLIPTLSRFALNGLVSQRWANSTGREPPERTVSYSITALGRDAIEMHAPIKVAVNRSTAKTPAQLLAEANERD